ncbi:hypothetical protein [Chitinophaga filiformis]|uniref:Uncharacterized protein n=1 Tax=Chitinophaga filiformis TaxID=104663 RepID=A0A1G7MJZ4_CHIFI|nr:hypothetical protein [Chitinophaga filiformis]SDF61984.1 hypothetical protein SAMN04488121_102463 [Chitinophaga filiformis]
MSVITYTTTKTTLPGWDPLMHQNNPRGYAYETPTHFIHIFGKDGWFYPASIRISATEKSTGTLVDWVTKAFGAVNIQSLSQLPGDVVDGVWRPGLYYNTDAFQALQVIESEKRSSELAILLLIERLEELFSYIHPDANGLQTYGHKSRELLILACTEVENFWKHFLRKGGVTNPTGRYNTNDYVKLLAPLYLKEFEFTLKTYSTVAPVSPFLNWNRSNPTTSLDWYDAYNKTKHDRDAHFNEATLWNCIQAVVANLVMYSVRFSPHPLTDQGNRFSVLYKQHFDGKLNNPDVTSFYTHNVMLSPTHRDHLHSFDPVASRAIQPFIIKPLVL